MSENESAPIQLTMDSPEARAAATEALRLVAAVRGVAASDRWTTNEAELGRVVSEVIGDKDEPLAAIAQRVAYIIQGLSLVGMLATRLAATAFGVDPLDIDAIIGRELSDLD